MSKQTSKFSDIVVNKKDSVNANIVVSYRIKHNDDGSKYFIGHSHDDDVIRPLCIILPQMSGYIKYFDNSEKTCHLKLKVKVCI